MASAAAGKETCEDAADTAVSELCSNFHTALQVLPSPEAAPAVQPTDANPATTSTNQYYSAHTQWMIENRDKFSNPVDFEIECSKVHRTSVQRRRRSVEEGEGSGWTSGDGNEDEEADERESDWEILRANRKAITELREDPEWGSRFRNRDWAYVIREKIGQGGQAKIYAGINADEPEGTWERHVVFKVFPRGYYLRDIVKLWPTKYAGVEHVMLMPNDGRIAMVMPRAWGDLRQLIDLKKQANRNQGPPFDLIIILKLMQETANSMVLLHSADVVHRDIKASNVLLCATRDHLVAWESNVADIEFLSPEYMRSSAGLADFECALRAMGTGFWRAPEVLSAMRDPIQKCSPTTLFTKESDVYSFGMLCYEIATGFHPFEREGFFPFQREGSVPFEREGCKGRLEAEQMRVISGERPSFPDDVDCRVKDLITRCWHPDGSQRPTFREIWDELCCLDNPLIQEFSKIIGDLSVIQDYQAITHSNKISVDTRVVIKFFNFIFPSKLVQSLLQ